MIEITYTPKNFEKGFFMIIEFCTEMQELSLLGKDSGAYKHNFKGIFGNYITPACVLR